MSLVFMVFTCLIEKIHSIDILDRFSDTILHYLSVVFELFKNFLIDKSQEETYIQELQTLL
jgi:hypothetical protein